MGRARRGRRQHLRKPAAGRARAIGANPQTIGYLERGPYSPSLELAFRLSEFFDLPIEALFAREPFAPTTRRTTTPREEIT